MLAHPLVIDLVVDAQALALVAQRPAALEELEDVVVLVEGPVAQRQEAAEEAIGVGVVGRPARPPHVRPGEKLSGVRAPSSARP